MRAVRRTLAGWVVALLAACSTPHETVVNYDFGLPPPPAPAGDAALGPLFARAEVYGPSWQDSLGIVYRLAYQAPDEIHVYANSRWVAAPASLLGQRLRERLDGGAAAAGAAPPSPDLRRLQIDLEEFSQVFEAPGASTVLLQARAQLYDPEHPRTYTLRRFSVRRAAPTPDAAGAVHGLQVATDEFLDQLLAWVRSAR